VGLVKPDRATLDAQLTALDRQAADEMRDDVDRGDLQLAIGTHVDGPLKVGLAVEPTTRELRWRTANR
jgi:hypothetical protein